MMASRLSLVTREATRVVGRRFFGQGPRGVEAGTISYGPNLSGHQNHYQPVLAGVVLGFAAAAVGMAWVSTVGLRFY